eukprot:jgi/Bigna1/128022/aug1.5_g2730
MGLIRTVKASGRSVYKRYVKDRMARFMVAAFTPVVVFWIMRGVFEAVLLAGLDKRYLVITFPCLIGLAILSVFSYMGSKTVRVVRGRALPTTSSMTNKAASSSQLTVVEGEQYASPHKARFFDVTSDRVLSMGTVIFLYLFVIFGASYAAFLPTAFGDPPTGMYHDRSLLKISTPYYQAIITAEGQRFPPLQLMRLLIDDEDVHTDKMMVMMVVVGVVEIVKEMKG